MLSDLVDEIKDKEVNIVTHDWSKKSPEDLLRLLRLTMPNLVNNPVVAQGIDMQQKRSLAAPL